MTIKKCSVSYSDGTPTVILYDISCTKYINVVCMRKYAGAFVYDKQVMGMGRRIIVRIKYFYNTNQVYHKCNRTFF